MTTLENAAIWHAPGTHRGRARVVGRWRGPGGGIDTAAEWPRTGWSRLQIPSRFLAGWHSRLLLLPRGLAHDVLARLGTEPPGRLASEAAEPQPRLVCSGLQRHGQGSLKARGQCHELRARRMALRTELTVHLHGVGFSKVKEEDRRVHEREASRRILQANLTQEPFAF